MAVTSIWPIKNNLKSVIDYVQNPEKITEEYYTENAALHIIDGVVEYAADEVKTERRQYVSCINCAELTAAKEFAYTHRLWKKQSGRPCYHGYQSFKPGEGQCADGPHHRGGACAATVGRTVSGGCGNALQYWGLP